MRLNNFCLPILTCCLATGCSTSGSRLATCQAEKEQLLTTIRGQRDSNRELTDQLASLESRLDQAEKELARSGSGTRLSSRPSDTPPTVKSDSLPWRAPAKTEFASAPTLTRNVSEGAQSSRGSALLALARRDRRLQYDATA